MAGHKPCVPIRQYAHLYARRLCFLCSNQLLDDATERCELFQEFIVGFIAGLQCDFSQCLENAIVAVGCWWELENRVAFAAKTFVDLDNSAIDIRAAAAELRQATYDIAFAVQIFLAVGKRHTGFCEYLSISGFGAEIQQFRVEAVHRYAEFDGEFAFKAGGVVAG